MKFEEVAFSKNGKSRPWDTLSSEEQDALREQIRKQMKEKFLEDFKLEDEK